MRTLSANLYGPVRRATLNGRPHLVAPVTLLVPGVLDGSDGPVFYPPEEVANEPEVWNGMPLVGYHAFRDGVPVSARRSDVLDQQGLGLVLNAHYDGKLKGEAWFDEGLTTAFDRNLSPEYRIVDRLFRGEPIEVSTGLFSKKEPAPGGATFNSKAYTHTARSYRPDHLAVLPDQVGACQIKDGCGILINHHRTCGGTVALTPEQKKQHVDYLTANCAWWKKPGDAVILNSLPDDKLVELKEGATPAPETVPVAPVPAAGSPILDLTKLTPEQLKELKVKLGLESAAPATVPAPAPASTVQSTAAAPTPPMSGTQTIPVTVPVAAPLTANQWLETAPAEIRSVFQNALAVERQEKESLVGRLTANVADPSAKQAAGQMLMPKGLEELRALVKLMGLQGGTQLSGTQMTQNAQSPSALFLGMAAPGPSHQAGYDPINGSEQDLLAPPTINWGKPKPEAAVA